MYHELSTQISPLTFAAMFRELFTAPSQAQLSHTTLIQTSTSTEQTTIVIPETFTVTEGVTT